MRQIPHSWASLVACLACVVGPLSGARGQEAPEALAPRHGALSASLGYSSNAIFYGRTQPVPYPYVSTELLYTSKAGAWASVLACDLLPTGILLDETDLSVGWDGDLTKKLDASFSYTHFLFAPDSPLIKSSVNNSFKACLGYDWGYVYTRLNGDMLFGPDSRDGFVVLDNSRYIALKKLGGGTLATEPKVSLIAGTQNFEEVSVRQQLIRGNSAGKGNGKANGHYKTITTYSTSFDVLAYELQVPLSYALGKVVGEVAYRYLLPVNVPDDDATVGRSYVTATLMVTF